VLGDAVLTDWCDRHLGARPACVLFRSGNLSEVIAAELADGRRVVIKARPFDQRIAGCIAVQAHLARAGFPCPVPLTAHTRVGALTVSAETLVPAGTQLPADDGAEPFAALLARLIRSAPGPDAVPSLAPSPPWTGWDHPGARLWPDRDDRGLDLNSITGPRWIDDAARRVRERLNASAAPPRVGHGDWESQNIRWSGTEPQAVHDWDSVLAQPEPAIVGLAAAVWPAAGAPGEAATVSQSAAFIASYQRAAGRQWAEDEIKDAWAAGLWVRLFNAKKDAADGGGPQLDRLAGEIADRLSLPPSTRPARRAS
jgi:Ser/Thr protein kinase RdoA (MazF antagonist)